MTGADAWQRLRDHRFVASAVLVLLAAIILWLPFQFEPSWYPAAMRFLHLGLPSVAVFAAFALLACIPSVTETLALAIGAFAYLAVAVILMLTDVANVGSAARTSFVLLGLFLWPTLVLIQVGRWLGWVPLPE